MKNTVYGVRCPDEEAHAGLRDRFREIQARMVLKGRRETSMYKVLSEVMDAWLAKNK